MGLYWLLLDLSNIYPITGVDSSKSTLFFQHLGLFEIIDEGDK